MIQLVQLLKLGPSNSVPKCCCFMSKRCVILGSRCGLMAVLFGALGTHELRHYFWNEKFTVFQTGVKCQFIRALGLLLIGLVVRWLPRDRLLVAGARCFSLEFCYSQAVCTLPGLKGLDGFRWLPCLKG